MTDPKPKLVVHAPEQTPLEFPVEKEEIEMGRDPSLDLPLEDRRVSRAHARISVREGAYVLEDLGSRNGTYLNDRKIKAEDGKVPIGDGDRIRLGSHIIECHLPGVPSEESSDALPESEKTRLAQGVKDQLLDPPEPSPDEKKKDRGEWPPVPDEESPGDEIATAQIDREAFEKAADPAMSVDLEFRDSELEAVRAQAAAEDETDVETVQDLSKKDMGDATISDLPPEVGYDITVDLEELREARARLVVSGEESSEILPVLRRRVTVGRGRHNDLVISHHTVSSVHSEVQFGPEGFTLVDKNSTNGTYLDNARIRSVRLQDGSYIMFGGIMALFLHEKGGGASKQDEEKVAEVLLRGGTVPKARMKEAKEKARSAGQRLVETLILERDLTPAQWWEASRMAGFGEPQPSSVSFLIPIIIVVILIAGLLAILYIYLLQ
jgi:pSer/pThr/pTyr-binding forkhead associated (FHA) protein